MQKWNIAPLACRRCRAPFSYQVNTRDYSIVKCSCREYPLVEGILYLYKEGLRKKALKLLKKKEYEKAKFVLLDQRRRILLPLYLIFGPNPINKISRLLFNRRLYQILGFKRVVEILTHFSFPSSWALYIKDRDLMPSFWSSYYMANVLKKPKERVLDAGCGTGQFLKVLAGKTNPSNVFGIDNSFLSLLFARSYFASPNSLLICCDIEGGLPFKSGSLDLVMSSDSFHYIKNKLAALKEGARVLIQQGIYAALHIVNSREVVYGNVRGITPQRLKALLAATGFKRSFFCHNTKMWMELEKNRPLEFRKKANRAVLENSFAYGFFASRKLLPASIKLKPIEFRKFKRTGKDFTLDKELLNDINFNSLIDRFDGFLFLSPHLDDAVLSCGIFLERLKGAKKKVEVTSVFTSGDNPPYSPQAKSFLKACGYRDATKLFRDRKREDAAAMKFYKAGLKHLGFVDAAWRRNEKGKLVYKSQEMQFSGQISEEDGRLQAGLGQKISEGLIERGRVAVFAPLGIGGHVDHLIVRQAAEKQNLPTFFWEDFPYNKDSRILWEFFLNNKGFKPALALSNNKGNKNKAIGLYRSQIKVLFPNGLIPAVPERYYSLERV
jgi:SAM-dependent methyltransferase